MAVRALPATYWPAIGSRAWVGLVGLSAALMLLPYLPGPGPDQSIFALVGERIVAGDMPYRDLWDHKPPGIYLISAVASILPGPTWPAMWLLSVGAITALTAALIPMVGIGMAVAAALIVAALSGAGLTETFAVVPAALAFRWRSERPIVAGALLACACVTSLQLVPAAIAVAIDWRRIPRYVLGGMLVAGPILLWLLVGGALSAAWDAVVTYSAVYIRLDRTNDLKYVVPLLLSLLPLGIAGLAGRREAGAMVWLVLGVALIVSNGRLFPHYGAPLAVPLAILASGARPSLRYASLTFVALATIWSVQHPFATEAAANRETGAVVASMTDGRILMWGHQGGVYLESDRAPAGRYPYIMPLVTPGYTTPTMIEEWVAELAADPPAMIVDVEAANPHWGDDDFLKPPPPGSAGGRNLDIVQPFRAWVADHYHLAGEIAGRRLYMLNRSAGS